MPTVLTARLALSAALLCTLSTAVASSETGNPHDRCRESSGQNPSASEATTSDYANGHTATRVIERFYRLYLDKLGSPTESRPKLKYSTEFASAIAENLEICSKFSDGICGFGTGGDPYLGSQEYEVPINFCSAAVRVTEGPAGLVDVAMNVYPSLADAFYERHITFKMTKEDTEWVVDDIIYSNGSARRYIREENAHYLDPILSESLRPAAGD